MAVGLEVGWWSGWSIQGQECPGQSVGNGQVEVVEA